MELIFASSNLNKVKEIKDILHGRRIISLVDLNDNDEVVEDGDSFEANAFLKAKYFFDKYQQPVFADDSGLVVLALDGKPGIYSARYAGANATYSQNNHKLLADLKDITNRQAYFITVICYIDQNGSVHYFEGKIDGLISEVETSKDGFGYDPIFYLPEYKQTFSELGNNVKNSISHRYKAIANFNKYLKEGL